MKLAIMQPYLFPYIGYFQLINAVDKFVFYDDVNYIKQGWINRNYILANNQKYLFSIPIEKISSYKKINEVKINSFIFEKTKKKLLKTIEQSYKKAPFFKQTYNIFVTILNSNDKFISNYARNSVIKISEYLKINTEIINTSKIYNNDYLKSSERIFDICKQENANWYINPIGGKELYSIKEFNKRKIYLNFLETSNIKYNQVSNQFIPFLSIIDVMMFNSPEEIKKMLENYTLI